MCLCILHAWYCSIIFILTMSSLLLIWGKTKVKIHWIKVTVKRNKKCRTSRVYSSQSFQSPKSGLTTPLPIPITFFLCDRLQLFHAFFSLLLLHQLQLHSSSWIFPLVFTFSFHHFPTRGVFRCTLLYLYVKICCK